MEGGKAPVSLHPAFPAVVALWFAALLGLGTLLVPIALLERFMLLTGVASTIPATAPPLGVTARLLIAVAGTVFGALFGWVIARRVAEAHKPTATARFSAASAGRRPLSAHDDLDEEGIAAPTGTQGTKRRSLAIAEDERKSDFLWAAPLPGEDLHDTAPPAAKAPTPAAEPEWTRAEPVADPAQEPVVAPAAEAVAVEALELSELAEDPAVSEFTRAPEPVTEHAEEVFAPQDFGANDVPVAQFPSAEELERRRIDRRRGAAARAPGGFERRLYLRRTADEPLPFVAPSLARRTPDNENTAAATLAVRMNFDAPAAAALEPYFEEPMGDHAEDPATAVDWENAPLGELGMIDLVHRLGASLEKRREQAVAQPAPTAVLAQVPKAFAPVLPVDDFDGSLDGVEAAEADEAAQAMAAYFGKPAGDPDPAAEPALPVAREWLAHRDEPETDDGDLAASFRLPLGEGWTGAEAAAEPIEPTDVESVTDEEQEEAGYGSLLSLRNNPFQAPREEFVRVEEPAPTTDDVQPAVVFPAASRSFDPPSAPQGQAPTAAAPPAEADEALRRALATLQRMSRGG